MLHLPQIQAWLQKPRTGWVNRKIPLEIAETVLEHSHKVAKAAGIYGQHFKDISLEKLVKMALYHDIAEYKVKDYTPWEISHEEKHALEKAVMLELKSLYPEAGNELYEYWMEFEANETTESQIVNQLDKLDAIVQALEYQKIGLLDAKIFYSYARSKLHDPTLISILDHLMQNPDPELDPYWQYFELLKEKGRGMMSTFLFFICFFLKNLSSSLMF